MGVRVHLFRKIVGTLVVQCRSLVVDLRSAFRFIEPLSRRGCVYFWFGFDCEFGRYGFPVAASYSSFRALSCASGPRRAIDPPICAPSPFSVPFIGSRLLHLSN